MSITPPTLPISDGYSILPEGERICPGDKYYDTVTKDWLPTQILARECRLVPQEICYIRLDEKRAEIQKLYAKIKEMEKSAEEKRFEAIEKRLDLLERRVPVVRPEPRPPTVDTQLFPHLEIKPPFAHEVKYTGTGRTNAYEEVLKNNSK